MWVADVNTDLGGSPANVWWLLGIALTTFSGLAMTYVLSRRPSRSAVAAAEPVAAMSAREAVDEFRQTFMVPLQQDITALRQQIKDTERLARLQAEDLERKATLAERAQASAERDCAAANAELRALRPQFEKALKDLAEERRRGE